MSDILISGVPFLVVGHRDGRFVRAPGLFAFARRQPCGRFEILHLELSEAIDRSAGPGHSRWSWAIAAGMDTLLVHLFGRPAVLSPDITDTTETVDWRPDAQVLLFAEDEVEGDAAAWPAGPIRAGDGS